MKIAISLYFLLFLLLNNCSSNYVTFNFHKVTAEINNSKIGMLKLSDVRAKLKCNYLLDFNSSGEVILIIKTDKGDLKLLFNRKNVLSFIKYPENGAINEYIEYQDGIYHIPNTYKPHNNINTFIEDKDKLKN